MHRLPSSLRPALLFAAALILGYAAHSLQSAFLAGPHTVQAQSRNSGSHPDSRADEPLDFQLTGGFGPTSALTIYSPTEHLLYVYQAVTQGNSHINCSFTLRIGRPGAAVDRQNCAPGNAF